MAQWFQRLVASAKYGTVSNATIQGYLRAAGQIETVWQQIDERVADLLVQGIAPWDAYTRMGYALAFVRACRLDVLFVQGLLKADALANPTGAGYLPQITYDQALALCEHIEPYLEEAVKAATDPQYRPASFSLPLKLGPRMRDARQRVPLSHIQGLIVAAQEMKDWSAGLLAQYELALHAAKQPLPQPVSRHLEQMKSELELGDFHLRTSTDLVGQISQGQTTGELSARAEDFLWEAMESFYRVSQLVAMPGNPARSASRVPDRSTRDQRSPEPELQRPTPEEVPHATPDMASLINPAMGGQHSDQGASSSDVSKLFDQVISGPGPGQSMEAAPSPDVSNLLNQVTTGPAAGQGSSARPSEKKRQEAERAALSHKPASEDNTLDLLSEICGEQEKDK